MIYSTQSGLLGLSGVSGDLRDVDAAAQQGNEDAKNAIDAYCYHIKKYIGAYSAAMGGLDAIAFAGGIGENSVTVRREVCSGLEFLGVHLDAQKNQSPPADGILSVEDSCVTVLRIPTNEEIVVARKAVDYLKTHA